MLNPKDIKALIDADRNSERRKLAEVGQRYSPQIRSRFQGSFQQLPFVGQDIRVMLNRGF